MLSAPFSNPVLTSVKQSPVFDQQVMGIKPVPNRNYEQIDTIRFITICFIIWGHCLIGWERLVSANVAEEALQLVILQAGKISTIIFFIVSGFLLRPKLQGYTLKSYFIERSPRVYFPWIFFIVLFLVIQTTQDILLKESWQHWSPANLIRLTYNVLDGLLLYSAYWFITTYLISMVLLVLLRKHADTLWLGGALGLISLFYSVNLYFQWIPANHSLAVFGYASFIWLGMKINKYYDQVMSFLSKTSWIVTGFILTVVFAIACLEGRHLTHIGCLDPFASNRFSNIIFSILFFLALMKLGKINVINRLNPRKTVYGIYLVHNILVFELMSILLANFSNELQTASIWQLLVYQLALFSLSVFLTYRLVVVIARSRLCWIIGIPPEKREKLP